MKILKKLSQRTTSKEIALRIFHRLWSPALQKEMEIKSTLLQVLYKP